MSTATLERKASQPRSFAWLPEAMLQLPPGRSLTVDGISWEQYDELLKLRDENNRNIKLRFDDGELEIMTKSNTHEQLKKLVALIIEELIDVMDTPMQAMGETTVSREDLSAGFEPDEWYYFGKHAVDFVGAAPVDFRIHPPPDLAVEIEIAQSVEDRLPLYAKMRVREIWRCAPDYFQILGFDDHAGDYMVLETSRYFPHVPSAEITAFFPRIDAVHYTALKREVREWASRKTLPIHAP